MDGDGKEDGKLESKAAAAKVLHGKARSTGNVATAERERGASESVLTLLSLRHLRAIRGPWWSAS
jgi:hypothetical protein